MLSYGQEPARAGFFVFAGAVFAFPPVLALDSGSPSFFLADPMLNSKISCSFAAFTVNFLIATPPASPVLLIASDDFKPSRSSGRSFICHTRESTKTNGLFTLGHAIEQQWITESTHLVNG
jgi:hypothetical protein